MKAIMNTFEGQITKFQIDGDIESSEKDSQELSRIAKTSVNE